MGAHVKASTQATRTTKTPKRFADWAGNVDDHISITGYAFSLGSGVITWSNKKQNTVSLSSAEA